MKKIISGLVSIVMMISFFTYFTNHQPLYIPHIEASAAGVDNIVARANYLYNITWVAQANVSGWDYTFQKGNTYHIPYGQPATQGKYICFGVSVDDFLSATKDSSSDFYTKQSYYSGSGTKSTYYASDCSAFVSYCWGVSRTTTSGWTGLDVTSYGKCNSSNVSNIEVGDAVNLAGSHVVLVTGISNGNYEITEQIPPQIKRSYYTATELANKYSSYTIYRYNKRNSVSPPPTVSDEDTDGDGSWKYTYYSACESGYTSIVDALNSIGVDSSYSNRQNIAELNGISNYSGTADQNTQMLDLLKSGKLIKSKTWVSATTTTTVTTTNKTTTTTTTTSSEGYWSYIYYPACNSRFTSIVDALKSIDVDSSYSNREKIAEVNNISNYTGSESQNTQMLDLLKQGKLIKSKTWVAGTATTTNKTTTTLPSVTTVVSSGIGYWLIEYYPKPSKTIITIPENDVFITYLNSISEDTSFENRKKIAEMNGISNYTGTANQNRQMLDLLKQGKLIKSKVWVVNGTTSTTKSTTTTTTTTSDTSTTTTIPLKVEDVNVTLKNGEQYQIKANQENLTFSSNATDIAVVSKNGLVTALGEGTAIISVINSDYDVVQIKVNVVASSIKGDANNDGIVNVADLVMLQKWLLDDSDELICWQNVDLYEDGIIDVFDMVMLRKLFIENAK